MKRFFFLALFLLAMANSAWCAITVTAEAPGVQTPTTAGAVVYTFDSLTSTTFLTNVSAPFGAVTGTYDKLYVRNPDNFGGANASKYPVAEAVRNTSSYTLTLSSPVNYFGLYWSAGDPSNRLDFYLGSTLLGSFTTATALGILPSTYYGTANGINDPSEPFAYLNFFGTAGTTFDRVILTAIIDGNGFESDNHAIAVSATPSGLPISVVPTDTPAAPVSTAVPTLSEWGEIFLVFLLAGGGGLLLRKRSGAFKQWF